MTADDQTSGTGRDLGGYSERYASDDGAADQGVRHAMGVAEETGDGTDYLTAVVALCGARLLVPLLATGDETMSPDPGRQAEMAAVLLRHPERGTAMLAFSGIDALQRWNAKARPVPATLDVVAQTAQQSGAGTLLIDFAGPHPLVIDGEVLANLAQSRRLVRLPDGFGWAATGS
ncbi:SseB family protein [Enemella evansiae]|uniref:SseB family protein n=1 Tax=Enemella evansiae TaxID=2016499 RepID=UPI0010DBCCF5|nr:SseB family protein [Enemella evansiae]TDO92690.1 type III secretion system (T3SS) SseB-like protein [Enemella evansiae]